MSAELSTTKGHLEAVRKSLDSMNAEQGEQAEDPEGQDGTSEVKTFRAPSIVEVVELKAQISELRKRLKECECDTTREIMELEAAIFTMSNRLSAAGDVIGRIESTRPEQSNDCIDKTDRSSQDGSQGKSSSFLARLRKSQDSSSAQGGGNASLKSGNFVQGRSLPHRTDIPVGQEKVGHAVHGDDEHGALAVSLRVIERVRQIWAQGLQNRDSDTIMRLFHLLATVVDQVTDSWQISDCVILLLPAWW